MKNILVLFLGGCLGFGLAVWTGKTEKQIVRVDAVTLKRSELHHVVEAIGLLGEKSAGKSYSRYESNSAAVAFECPTNDACNLEVPARGKEVAEQIRVTMSGVMKEAPEQVREITPGEIHAETSALNQVLKSARSDNGDATGSIYDRLQLRNGDVITAVNGRSVASPAEALTKLNSVVQNGDQIKEVTIIRNGLNRAGIPRGFSV